AGSWLLVLGYFRAYAKAILKDPESSLPEWSDLKGLAREGISALVLLLVCFSPALVSLLAGLLVVLRIPSGIGFSCLTYSLGAMIFFITAFFFALLSALLFPICFF